MARYSLFVLKLPLNTEQTNKLPRSAANANTGRRSRLSTRGYAHPGYTHQLGVPLRGITIGV